MAERDYKTILIADDVDYDGRGVVKQFIEDQGAIFVDGPIPENAEYPPDARVYSYQPTLNKEGITKAVGDGQFDGIIVAATEVVPEVGKEQIDGRPFLLFAVRIGAGFNNVESVSEAGGKIMTTPTWNSWATVESLWMGIQAAAAPIDLSDQHDRVMRDVADSNDLRSDYTGMLKGQRIGIIGLGNISGEIFTKQLNAKGMNGVGYSRSFSQTQADLLGIEFAHDLSSVVSGADIIVVQAPLNQYTKEMIKKEHFEAANPGHAYVNYARAGMEDLEALEESIRRGHTGGVAIDFDNFPGREDSPMKPYREMLERLTNEGAIKDPRRFRFSHHTAADPKGPDREEGAIQAVRQMEEALKGKALINPVPIEDDSIIETRDDVGRIKLANLVAVLNDHGPELAADFEVMAQYLGNGGNKVWTERDAVTLNGMLQRMAHIERTLQISGKRLER